jgi:hypothetical protein
MLEAAKQFAASYQAAVDSTKPEENGEPVSGLARVFSGGAAVVNGSEAAANSSESGSKVSPNGTSVPKTVEQILGEGSPESLAGVFRDVAEESIEPSNAILLWRRPAEPPPVAWQGKLVLAEAIRRAGYDPKDFAVSYWETKAEWPGGAMIVPELTLVAPNGRKLDMSPDLIVGSIDAAVADVQRLMSQPPEASTPAVT